MSCAAKYNGKNRIVSEASRKKLSDTMKARWNNSEAGQARTRLKQAGTVSQMGRHKKPKSILELSKRTVSKVLRRLGLVCSRCGWNQDISDIHHIRGKEIPDPDNHGNLTYICPNCHRLADRKKIKPEDLVPLSSYIPENWQKFYYG